MKKPHPKLMVLIFALLAALASATAVLAASSSRREFNAALAAKPDPAAGAAHFEVCAACHGTDGGGADNGNVPAIASQHFRVLVKQLVDFRHNDRWDIRMEHFVDRHHLKDAQAIADVARYIADLPRINRVGLGNGQALVRGEELYRARCADCHGAQAQGADKDKMPRLAGQHQLYLVRQLQDAADGRRPNMQGRHVGLARNLNFDDIQAVADYLARLGSAPPR
jgi:cytochrome c553